jgi:predicted TIM-barrel fold metal-dependent hydrolase
MPDAVPRIIDCHQHTGWLGHDGHGLVRYLNSVNVATCWLLSWEATDGGLDFSYEHLSIDQVFAAWQLYPERIIPFAGVDCRRDNAEQMLRDCHARGARGCGEIKLRMNYDDPAAIRLFRLAGSLGMPVTLHLQYPSTRRPDWWYGGRIGSLERAVAACPETNFLGHAQSWWAHISGDADPEQFETHPKGPVTPGGEVVRLLETYPNLYADLSAGSGFNALTRDAEFGRSFLVNFADKLLYGVDNYDDNLLSLLNRLNLPADVYAKITSGNARRLLGEG